MNMNTFNINNFNSRKVYNTFLVGKALYFKYKDNYGLMKKDIYSVNHGSRSTKYRHFIDLKNAVSFYLANREDTLND